LKKSEALIYIAMSRHNNESPSYLASQLECLHLNLLSFTTNHLLKML